MRIVPDEDGHVRTALGLYYLGDLDEADRVMIERHLADCPACLRAYDEAGGAMPAVEALAESETERSPISDRGRSD